MTRSTRFDLVCVFQAYVVALFGLTAAANAELLTSGGDFGGQSNGVNLASPWVAGTDVGTTPVASIDAQSPFTNVFPKNAMGTYVVGNYINESTPSANNWFVSDGNAAPAIPLGTQYLYLNADFMNLNSTSTYYKLAIAHDAASIYNVMAAAYICGDRVDIAGPGFGLAQSIPITTNVWYNLQLKLDLAAKTYSGSLTPFGGAIVPINSATFVNDVTPTSALVYQDKAVNWIPATPAHYIDNFVVSTTPVPEPGTLVLLGTSMIGLLAYAWRKRKCVPS